MGKNDALLEIKYRESIGNARCCFVKVLAGILMYVLKVNILNIVDKLLVSLLTRRTMIPSDKHFGNTLHLEVTLTSQSHDYQSRIRYHSFFFQSVFSFLFFFSSLSSTGMFVLGHGTV